MDGPDGSCLSTTNVRRTKENDDIFNYSSNAESSSQPATQPLSTEDSFSTENEEEMEVELDTSWGYLYPNINNVSRVSLDKDVMSFGRSTCNHIIFTEDMMGKRRFVSCSKIHFILKRSIEDDVVTLEDKSSNGTFVNGILVGKGNKRQIHHNSYISIAEVKWKPYVFMFRRDIVASPDFPEELTQKYIVSRELGKGACGLVRLGFRVSDNERVAIKIINKKNEIFTTANKRNNVHIMNEVKVLQAVNHPCIIRLEDVVDTESNLYIVLELADGGELFDKIIEKTKLNEKEAKLIFYQIASALQYLHSKNIAHRDLKPENILLDSNESDRDPLVKITDMGLSKLVDYQSVLKTFCGTPQYLAPEVLTTRVRGDGTYSHKVDCWSMGVILFILLTGCPPFSPERRDGKDLVRQIAEGDYSFDRRLWSTISDEAVDLVRKLMIVDVAKRLSATQVLNHPWLRNDTEIVLRAQKLMRTEYTAKDQQRKRSGSGDVVDAKKIKIGFNEELITPLPE